MAFNGRRPLRAAIVGFGVSAEKTHAPAYLKRSDVEIAACVDPSAPRREAFAKFWPWARTYESFDALLASRSSFDFVDVATPPARHGEAVLRALESGWNVLCEKPLAPDLLSWEALEAASRRAGRNLMTVHNWAYAPHWLKVREIIGSGALGLIRHVEIRCLRTRPSEAAGGSWRSSAKLGWGGISVDHGWHSFYLARRCLGSELEHAEASLEAGTPESVDESASVFLRCGWGTTGFVYMTWRSPFRSNSALVVGERGVVEVRDESVELRAREDDLERFDFRDKLSAGSAHPEWFARMLADYLPALSGEKCAVAAGNLAESRFCAEALGRVREASAPRPVALEAAAR